MKTLRKSNNESNRSSIDYCSQICQDSKENKEILLNSKKSNKNKNDYDALILEYCPKIFKKLRDLDEYDEEELNEYLIY